MKFLGDRANACPVFKFDNFEQLILLEIYPKFNVGLNEKLVLPTTEIQIVPSGFSQRILDFVT